MIEYDDPAGDFAHAMHIAFTSIVFEMRQINPNFGDLSKQILGERIRELDVATRLPGSGTATKRSLRIALDFLGESDGHFTVDPDAG